MTPEVQEQFRFPIGRYAKPAVFTPGTVEDSITRLAELPGRLREAIQSFDESRLDTPYREGGWTVRQVVHHLADSHINCYIRCKLALTEDTPTIKPYDENAWAQLWDARYAPMAPSLAIIDAVHSRWTALLRHCSETEISRTFYHPESKRTFALNEIVHFYAWHGEHHLAHILSVSA